MSEPEWYEYYDVKPPSEPRIVRRPSEEELEQMRRRWLVLRREIPDVKKNKYELGQYLEVYTKDSGELLRRGTVSALREKQELQYGNNQEHMWWEWRRAPPLILNSDTGDEEEAYKDKYDVVVRVFVEDIGSCVTCARTDLTKANAYDCSLGCGALFCSEACFDPRRHAVQCSVWQAANRM